jgi:hypothetical protein
MGPFETPPLAPSDSITQYLETSLNTLCHRTLCRSDACAAKQLIAHQARLDFIIFYSFGTDADLEPTVSWKYDVVQESETDVDPIIAGIRTRIIVLAVRNAS